jgi:DNA-binding NarL/FixJ family response regulator
MRELLAETLSDQPRLLVVGEADSARSTLALVRREQPDILVLDHELGDGTASEILDQVRALSPATRVLLYSGRADVHQLGQRLDADRAVSKGDDVGQLLEALAVLAG